MTIERDRHRGALLYDAARLERAANRAIGWGDHEEAAHILAAVKSLRTAAEPPKPKTKPAPLRSHAWRRERAVAPKRAKGIQ